MFDIFNKRRIKSLKKGLDDYCHTLSQTRTELVESQRECFTRGLALEKANQEIETLTNEVEILHIKNDKMVSSREDLLDQIGDLEQIVSDESNHYQQRLSALGEDIKNKHDALVRANRKIDRMQEWLGNWAEVVAPGINQLVDGWSRVEGVYPWDEE